MRKLAVLIVSFWGLSTCVCESSLSSDQMVKVGSHSLQINVQGEGTPVVVIDAGLADQFDKLKPLQESLAKVTRVVTYNRAGYGQSEPGPLPRGSSREADELKALLDTASIPGPYVLVGHSLGALNVQVFATKYPKAVAGMVLLDPPPLAFILGQEYKDLAAMAEQMTAQWEAIADSVAKSTVAEEKAKSTLFRMIASEHREMFGETAKAIAAITTFGDVPLVVMASGKSNPAFGDVAEKFQKFWIEQSRAVANKSTHGKFVLAEGSSHFLYLDVPDLVVENVLGIVDQARAKR
jgi:pimeloyl-ACP methyl ester carboxylesterase